jgi:hypothetical protein
MIGIFSGDSMVISPWPDYPLAFALLTNPPIVGFPSTEAWSKQGFKGFIQVK